MPYITVSLQIHALIQHKTGSLRSSFVPLPQAVLPPAASSVLCEELEGPPLVEETAVPGCCFLRQSAAGQQQCHFSEQSGPATQSDISAQKKETKRGRKKMMVKKVKAPTHNDTYSQTLSICVCDCVFTYC